MLQAMPMLTQATHVFSFLGELPLTIAAQPRSIFNLDFVPSWLWPFTAIGISVLLGFACAFLVLAIASRAARRVESEAGLIVIRCLRKPLLLIGAMIALHTVLGSLTLGNEIRPIVQRVSSLIFIAALAWLLIQLIRAIEQIVQQRFRMDVSDNLEARRLNTQVRVLERSAMVLIIVLAAAAMLMTFPQLRQVGTSLLASAGLAGLVVGFAARPVLTNLIAGVQLALTQPIRLDDVVIVEGEWGRIEEITATYVVVRIWDERRLIVPLSHFVESAFQNWTRTRADILGTAMIFVDYSVPVREVREELHRVLQEMPEWDGRAWALHVTDLTDRTMQLRALMSAADAGKAFELRCRVRERLVEFIRDRFPDGLPRIRADVAGERVSVTQDSDQ